MATRGRGATFQNGFMRESETAMRFVSGCDLRDIALNRPKTIVAQWLYAIGMGFGIINLAGLALGVRR